MSGFDSRPYYTRIAAQPEVKQRPIRKPHARAGHEKSGTTRPPQTRILPGDYVHTWWDWGSATWFHAERNVLTTPLNQSQDTFVLLK